MKNSLITLLAFATVTIISCTKTKLPKGPTAPVEQSRTVFSSWTTMSFSEMTNDNGGTYLQADASLPGVSDVNPVTHISFAYIKMQDAAGAVSYQRIPFNITNDNEDLSIGYTVDNGILSIRVDNNRTSGQSLTADRFQNSQFRLFMVSTTDALSSQVDWDNYSSVENAFGTGQVVRTKH